MTSKRIMGKCWTMRWQLLMALLLAPTISRAGGPRYVAGDSYFNPTTKGTALTWSNGIVSYYTDQGDLSPILPHASADSFVADAFSRWTLVSTAAVSANLAGQLGEDVNGSNVFPNGDGTFTLPSDILPAATDKPVAIVYDADGQVTDALLGVGAGGVDGCFGNAVFGGLDNFSTDAHLAHALVVLNGNCAQTSDQLPDAKYRLVRVLGRVLGLDWSQVNVNVLTFAPHPTADDYAGFTIMHAVDNVNCVPISLCYPNADQPKMDDRAALSRLYPVTNQNLGDFPGKLLFLENTIRLHGSVYFADGGNQAAQGMQGVNVVARWIDPGTGQPSHAYSSASVSGFLFRGNAGNAATGFNDVWGQAYDRFGSDDVSIEGTFDLAGLEIPDSRGSAQYQLSVEAIDPAWSQTVGPYGFVQTQVKPSGTAQAVIVTVSKGGDLQQDLLMQGSSVQATDRFEPASWDAPAQLPPGGEWAGSLSAYGNSDYFQFAGRADRTLSVEVTSLGDDGVVSQDKAQPVIGMWALEDPGTYPAPANTPLAFNCLNFGMSRLDALLLATTSFRLGISDYRGDGRPDYRYLARVFYGDTVTPARASVAGGTAVDVAGFGFRTGTNANIAEIDAPVLGQSATHIIALTPALPDGVHSLGLGDPMTGASSEMTNVITYGAAADDIILLISGSNPATPVGGEAPNPIRVRILQPDGLTPVAGASVVFSSSPALSFSACSGLSICTLFSDLSGDASTRATVLQAGVMTITVSLAPASYPAPKFVRATLLGTTPSLAIVLSHPFAWIAQGATLDIPLTARVLANGLPVSGRGVNYQVLKGSGGLSAATTVTDANGYSTTTLHLTALNGDVLVSACTEPGDAPCQNFSGTAVPSSLWKLEAVSGSPQVVTEGQSFAPVTVRVTDSSTPANPVRGATLDFASVVGRAAKDVSVLSGEDIFAENGMPIILAMLDASGVSDADGLAALPPSTGGFDGALLILGTTTGGTVSLPFALQSLWPVSQPGPNAKPVARSALRNPKPVKGYVRW